MLYIHLAPPVKDMNSAITLLISTFVTFLGHHFGEWFFNRGREKRLKLVIKSFHIHHSFFGLATAAIALIFTGGWLMFVLFGYSLGNIWQHKYTHNRLGEKGLVFLSRIM